MFDNDRDDGVVLQPFDGLGFAYDEPDRSERDESEGTVSRRGFVTDL